MRHKEFLEKYYKEISHILNCMEVGIWITDADTCVTMVNDKSMENGGLNRDELIGTTMYELIESGYVLYDSSCIKAVKSGKRESIIQELGEGGYLMATSVPLYYNGEIDLIVCVERDITEIMQLRKNLEKKETAIETYKSKLIRMMASEFESTDNFIAYSNEMIKVKKMAEKVGELDVTVIITGESGTGKEEIANIIQKRSTRKDGPYIKVNCAAIPEALLESEFFGYEKGSFTGASNNGKIGLFELADGGTLFLDEIGDLPLSMQSKLLRVMQDMEIRRVGGSETIHVDVRIISATNKDLKEEVKKGSFRSDLYYRLFVVPINVPPLRNRVNDIAPLANSFLEKFCKQYSIDVSIDYDAISALEEYNWPGNVRELRNLIERLVVMVPGNTIKPFHIYRTLFKTEHDNEDIITDDCDDQSLADKVANYERAVIEQYVNKYGSLSTAAKALSVDKSTISRKLKRYNNPK